LVTRRVKTGGAYVATVGGPAQWQNTYEDQEFTGSYVATTGGPAQWQYAAAGVLANAITTIGADAITTIGGDPITVI